MIKFVFVKFSGDAAETLDRVQGAIEIGCSATTAPCGNLVVIAIPGSFDIATTVEDLLDFGFEFSDLIFEGSGVKPAVYIGKSDCGMARFKLNFAL